MGTRAAGRVIARSHAKKYDAPANLSSRCLLCIVGVLGGFMALVQGMIAVQALEVNTASELSIYWTVAMLGIWVPAIAIFGSIVGVVIRDKVAMLLLIASPIATLTGFALITFGPLAS
ncbi:MAG: hypothetical protein Q7T44_00520 [Parvibaculum sp.]|nr:hypothetical protein [Parvibaculum sp.]